MRFKEMDKILIVSTLALLVVGIVMVYSSSSIMASNKFGDEYFFVKKHLVFALGGLVLFVVASKVPYTIYRKLAYPVLLLAVALLVLVMVPGFGVKAGAAVRWLRVGPFTFQPSEFAKLAVVFFLAYSLAAKKEKIKSFNAGFLPNVVIPGIVVALVVSEPDFGTGVFIALLVLIMIFTAGVRLRYLLGVSLLVVPILLGVVRNFDYMVRRVVTYMNPWADPLGDGFQMVQSFVAFGSGGITGIGLGEGRQKLFYLPEAHTDFILSVIGEELGFIGVGGVAVLYLVILYCGIKIAMKAKDLHGTYLALGITFMVVLQAAINMAVVLGLLPPKGMPLPLISYGGTSLLMNMVAIGILLNIYIVENDSR